MLGHDWNSADANPGTLFRLFHRTFLSDCDRSHRIIHAIRLTSSFCCHNEVDCFHTTISVCFLFRIYQMKLSFTNLDNNNNPFLLLLKRTSIRWTFINTTCNNDDRSSREATQDYLDWFEKRKLSNAHSFKKETHGYNSFFTFKVNYFALSQRNHGPLAREKIYCCHETTPSLSEPCRVLANQVQ